MPGPTSSAPAVGSILADRYEIVRHLARGGMADVYEAQDHQLQRRVAVKVFRAAAAADRARFDAEVVVLAALNHPGLVQVYDAGDQDGDAFVVLELIEGPTLAARVADRGSTPPAAVADLGAQVADALAYVHERGVVHRDVTPSNILCGPDGRPRLADFGIARLVDTTRITAAATAVGTAAYMAPEQVQGHDVTPAADVYSLGLVLLELLTGRPAFTGAPHEVMVVRLARDPDTATGVPGAWRDLLSAMTQRAAPNRPSAATVRDRLAALYDGVDAATGAVAAVGPVAVAAPHGVAAASDAPTTTAPAVGEGTTIMPAILVPDPPDSAEHPRGHRRAVAAGVIGAALVVAVVAAAGGGGIDAGDLPTTTTTTVEPVVTAPPAPTTTAPVVTTAPPDPGAKGKGNGKGRGDDDDD